ncbi:MAG: alpha-L-rhamnosidase C-terminal domain-containing protein [Verrucomicrobiota bacterium]
MNLVPEKPGKITTVAPGVILVDFDKVAFGNLLITPPRGHSNVIKVHFGEALENGRINRKPPGTVRYASVDMQPKGTRPMLVTPPADVRNTKQPEAVLTPERWGVLLPFRWVEIEGWPGEMKSGDIVRQSAFSATWNDGDAAFQSSDEMLNRIWELCRYSIKATTFAGVYVDGDRERIPYEADAYLNQLSHYATSQDIQMARDTFDRLMKLPTWPTEWAPHMVFMAYADWMHTGDAKWLSPRYESLKKKLLLERVGEGGLVLSNDKQIKRDDIVDWPTGERDGYVFTKTNTVVNAFHLRALREMSELAIAVGEKGDATKFAENVVAAKASFQAALFDSTTGIYRDGVGTSHSSIHANLFPLAFRLVPAENKKSVTDWVAGRGMACSVYAAQYLLEGLFENGADVQALKLITAPNDRSWKHMLESGTTITWEAWDQRYKPNQDWNHAWGAAPANLLPRFVLGAQPLSPGWKRAVIRPHPGGLTAANGKIPTPRGPVLVDWKNGASFMISIKLPAGMTAKVELPATTGSTGVSINGKPAAVRRDGSWWILEKDVSGTARIEVK